MITSVQVGSGCKGHCKPLASPHTVRGQGSSQLPLCLWLLSSLGTMCEARRTSAHSDQSPWSPELAPGRARERREAGWREGTVTRQWGQDSGILFRFTKGTCVGSSAAGEGGASEPGHPRVPRQRALLAALEPRALGCLPHGDDDRSALTALWQRRESSPHVEPLTSCVSLGKCLAGFEPRLLG